MQFVRKAAWHSVRTALLNHRRIFVSYLFSCDLQTATVSYEGSCSNEPPRVKFYNKRPWEVWLSSHACFLFLSEVVE